MVLVSGAQTLIGAPNTVHPWLIPIPLLSQGDHPCSSWCLTKSPFLGDKDLLLVCFPPASSEVAWEYFPSSRNNPATLQTRAMPPLEFHSEGKLPHLCLPQMTPTTPSVKYSQNISKVQNHFSLCAPVIYPLFLTSCRRIDLG